MNLKNTSAPKKLSALIVEDDDRVAKTLKRVFANHGFITFYSKSAVNLEKILEKDFPSIITIDLKMEGHSGFDVIKFLKKYSMTEKSIVIVISGEKEVELISAVNLGADMYLQKPFSKSDLDKIIRKFFPNFNSGVQDERGNFRSAS